MRRSLLFLALLALVFTAPARSEEKTAPEEKTVVVARVAYQPADEKDKGLWSELRCRLARSGSQGSIWMGGFGRWNVQFSIENDGKDLWIGLTEANGVTLGSSAEKPVSLKENPILDTLLPLEWNKDIVFFKTDFGTMTIRLSKEVAKAGQ